MAIIISVILLFLGIGALIIIHICVVARTFRRGLGSEMMMGERSSSIGSTSMSRDDVEKLPCYDYMIAANKSKGSSPADCAVCLDNFKRGDKCRLLPLCNHSFHAKCVDEWLLKNPNCPICRSIANSSRFSDVGSVDQLREGQGQSTEISTRHSSQLSDDVRIELGAEEAVQRQITHEVTSAVL
ncbi:hypothetical protein LWI29_013696 [Acer saccharum]|uniref:RING-type E3 ubiquitin transferase n=1 Tax=Acer saccharum TaxID=4024 RepID=A0AA39SDE9_ACESA|nr:hypothetical protein LWI29_013696 [Acer saccharum]KAK1567140.1 hypothetical protein Q3G72_008567 [Acer saccharum]